MTRRELINKKIIDSIQEEFLLHFPRNLFVTRKLAYFDEFYNSTIYVYIRREIDI